MPKFNTLASGRPSSMRQGQSEAKIYRPLKQRSPAPFRVPQQD